MDLSASEWTAAFVSLLAVTALHPVLGVELFIMRRHTFPIKGHSTKFRGKFKGRSCLYAMFSWSLVPLMGRWLHILEH